MSDILIDGYRVRTGSGLDIALLVKFMHLTYQELFPDRQNFSHLAETTERYFSKETPLWWVVKNELETKNDEPSSGSSLTSHPAEVGCIWLGNAVDQVRGDRHAHIFLLYVMPLHRHRGIGSALMRRAEDWAKKRGDRQIGLQVFETNQPALSLYRHLGYQTQSLWMVKPLTED